MPEYVISKTINSPHGLTDEFVRENFKNMLQKEFDKIEWNVKNTNQFKGRVKSAVFNPVVDMVGELETRLSEESKIVKVMITADAKVNGWFWFGVIISVILLFFGVIGGIFGFLVDGWMWHSQKKKIKVALESACEQFDFSYSSADELSRKTLVNANLTTYQESPLTESMASKPATVPPNQQVTPTQLRPEGWCCSHCKTENEASHHFCYSCGHEMEKPKPTCPGCGASMDGKMRFCPSCGTALTETGDTSEPELRATEIPAGAVQNTPPIPSHQQTPVPSAFQPTATKKKSFPMGAVAVIVLGLMILILALSKGDVLMSFFEGTPKVTASQENPPAQVASKPVPAVQVTESENLVRVPTSALISASNVNMRAGHSILAQRVATLPRGQNMTVLGIWVADSDQEAILKKDLNVEVDGKTKTLGKGKAVSLVQYDASQGKYLVSLQDRSTNISGWTSAENVKSLKGSIWYKVSTPGGKTGWVLGEFLSIQR